MLVICHIKHHSDNTRMAVPLYNGNWSTFSSGQPFFHFCLNWQRLLSGVATGNWQIVSFTFCFLYRLNKYVMMYKMVSLSDTILLLLDRLATYLFPVFKLP